MFNVPSLSARAPLRRGVTVRQARCGVAAALTAAVCASVSAPSFATTTLNVDLSTSYRPVTHVGIGSLYGITDALPANLDTVLKPLHPNMFTNPASSSAGTQQPGVQADAITVAGRLAPYGARVTIRLADWFPGWYSFTNMTDWFNKMATTVSAKNTAHLTNIYAYEIWNEPNGTWASDPNTIPGGNKTLSFNAFWKQSYDKLRQLDPNVKITGPSLAGYNGTYMQSFLTYCKANNCLPDIVGWHEGQWIANDVAAYRALEKQLGVGPLPITMNEYSGYGDIKDEGRPGASAPLIAQLERSGVDTACITWWAPNSVPGHLGSLLASDTKPNGGWYLYQWYGDMAGNMVSTSAPAATAGSLNLDGFASLDTTAHTAYVVLGGLNDGTVKVVVKGLKAAQFGGTTVHAVVEHATWGSITTVSTGPTTVSTADVAVANDEVTVSIGGTNGDDGYRLTLTPVGGAGGSSSSSSSSSGKSTTQSTVSSGAGGGPHSTSVSYAGSGGAPLSGETSSTRGGVGGSGRGGGAPETETAGTGSNNTDHANSGCSCRMGGLSARLDALWLLLAATCLVVRRRRHRS